MGEETFAKPILLHVEDDAAATRALSRIAWQQFVVRGAESLASALAYARSGSPFDAVVVDVFLPDGSGFAVAERLRAQRPSLPIAVLSGGAEKRDEAERRNWVFFTKPIEGARFRAWAEAAHWRLPQERVRRGLEKLADAFPTLSKCERDNLRLAAIYTATHGPLASIARCELALNRGVSENAIKRQMSSAAKRTRRRWRDLIAHVLELGDADDDQVNRVDVEGTSIACAE